MDHSVPRALPQLFDRPRDQVTGLPDSNAGNEVAGVPGPSATRRVRNLALALMSLALAFYFGFIAITIYRSHH